MSSATTAVAVQYRLQEWAAQIRECQNRPAGMSVVDWCATHGITKAQTAPRKRSVSGIPCARGSDAADCAGMSKNCACHFWYQGLAWWVLDCGRIST